MATRGFFWFIQESNYSTDLVQYADTEGIESF